MDEDKLPDVGCSTQRQLAETNWSLFGVRRITFTAMKRSCESVTFMHDLKTIGGALKPFFVSFVHNRTT